MDSYSISLAPCNFLFLIILTKSIDYEKSNTILRYYVLSLLSSCDKEADCQEQQSLPVTTLKQEYGCTDTRYGLAIDLSDDYTIIRSQSGFDNLVTSNSCNPKIDFTKYDLLIGKRRLSNGNVSIDYALTRVCPSNKLRLKATFHQNISAEAPNITYHALIPKLKGEKQ